MTTERSQGLLLADITIGIVGAGIGGLTLALALRQMGFPAVTVYEAQVADCPPVETSSHTLAITANASRVLHALGLEEALSTHANQPGFAYLRNRRSGFLLIQRPLGDFSETRYGAPTYLLTQADLISLLRSASSRRGVQIEYGTKIIDVDPPNATLTLEQGNTKSFTAVVVATGGSSDLRHCISRTAAEVTAQNYQIIAASCQAPTTPNATFTWLDDNFYCQQYPLGTTRSDLLLVRRSNSTTDDSLSAETLLRQLLRDSHRHLDEVVQQLEWADYRTAPVPSVAEHWYAGKVALLGDACHSLGIHQPHGACAAIEDSWVLATMMERWEEDPAAGFFDYQRFRKPRISRMQRETSRSTEELLISRGTQKFRRNFRWGMTNRFLPEVSMAELDWLYGYDCIKGFA